MLQLEGVGDFAERCPDQFAALIDCSAFVNWRRLETGGRAILALSYYHDARHLPRDRTEPERTREMDDGEAP
jgi:hypothetical protein